MKILKIIFFGILGLFLLLFGYQFTKVSKTSTTKLKDAFDSLFGKTKVTEAITGSLSIGKKTVVTSTNNVNTPTKPKVNDADKLGLTYMGQPIYKSYNGVKVSGYENIGYLADGTLLTIYNTAYKNGEYVYSNPVFESGVEKNSSMGKFTVSGTNNVEVYAKKSGRTAAEYSAFGFTQDGTFVFSEIFNAGYQDEYTTYHT